MSIDPHMSRRRPPSMAFALRALAAMQCGAALASPVTLHSGVYEIAAQTVPPHLEENLRYATTRERQCIETEGVSAFFPILRHQAFDGCQLTGGRRENESIELILQCQNPQAATGTARLAVTSERVTGVLDIKMGGKNMTLSQRIDGARKGPCESKQ